MITKFDRIVIASINSTQAIKTKKAANYSKSIAVPQKETFKHIFDNAKKGNEFAAVLMDEWQSNCSPQNNEEMHVVSLINKAAEKIFK